jgi:hypothetical protein
MSLISGNLIVPPIRTGFQTSWMHLRGVCHSSAKRVRFGFPCFIHELTLGLLVTDMLLSLLNICTKEELEEEDLGLGDTETPAEHAERKRVIKSKILAVGRVSRVFALLRYAFRRTSSLEILLTIKRSEESERVSELKSVAGMKELPADSLANGAEGIKDMITNFEDAYVETAIHII